MKKRCMCKNGPVSSMAMSSITLYISKHFIVYQVLLPGILTTVLGWLDWTGINNPVSQVESLRLLEAIRPEHVGEVHGVGVGGRVEWVSLRSLLKELMVHVINQTNLVRATWVPGFSSFSSLPHSTPPKRCSYDSGIWGSSKSCGSDC